tara:strand:- start:264 stop:638 length:375 start_codon:yes stop_codon:yes gene_type:complete
MATITEATTTHDGQLSKVVSDPATAASSDSVDIPTPNYSPHCFLGVQMFGAGGEQILTGATGTFTVAVYTVNSTVPESPTVNTISAAAPVTIDWNANTERVVVTAGALGGGVVTWRVIVTLNRS